MALKTFTDTDNNTIHYIFGTIYTNSINKFATFNGHVYAKWISKEANKMFFQNHYPEYCTGMSQTDLPVFLLQLLKDINPDTVNFAVLHFISLIKNKSFMENSVLNNQDLVNFCENYNVPESLVIPETPSQFTDSIQSSQSTSPQNSIAPSLVNSTQFSTQSASSFNENGSEIFNKLSTLFEQKFKSYADVIKGIACSSSTLDIATNETKDLVFKERNLLNHLTTNKSYKQNKSFLKYIIDLNFHLVCLTKIKYISINIKQRF